MTTTSLTNRRSLWLAALLLSLENRAELQIDYANKGVDGALVTLPTDTEIIIDLGKASAGAWDAAPAAEQRGNGMYDSSKWAVVFKYSSVSIHKNTTIRFRNHPSRAPVVWLVDGDARIDGTVDLTGYLREGGQPNSGPWEPGPGGFRGSYWDPNNWGLAGMGPGGAPSEQNHGSFSGGGNGSRYGNGQLVPLIGGSGGGYWLDNRVSRAGLPGGGAILVVCKGVAAINGSIDATPINITAHGRGSGGAVRVVSDRLAGAGQITANGPAGNHGRIRLEASDYSGSMSTSPRVFVVSPIDSRFNRVLIWPPEDYPTVRIVSIGGQTAPSEPLANLDMNGTDVQVPGGVPVDVEVEVTNLRLEPAPTVSIRVVPASNRDALTRNAEYLSGDDAKSRWIVRFTDWPAGYAAVQVRAVGQ